MTARELRIGNYVYDTKSEVNIINLEALTYICKEPLNQVKPIPLTEEWLLRFGFIECSDNGELKGNDRFFINSKLKGSIGLSPKFTYSLTGTRLYYVHQLQNLYYALTGEELTIQ